MTLYRLPASAPKSAHRKFSDPPAGRMERNRTGDQSQFEIALDSSLVAKPVGQVRRVVCASEQYLRRHGIPKVPSDIRKHRCVRHLGLVPRSEWHFLVGNRNVTIPITSVITRNEIDSAVKACIDGLGLGMFLSYMIAPYRNDGHVKYVLEEFETAPVPIQVVYPYSKLLSSKVRAFVDECVRKLRCVGFD